MILKEKHVIIEVLETYKKSLKVKTDKKPNGIYVDKVDVKEEDGVSFFYKRKLVLDEFWQDVNNRVGMDVCTPFIERFKGHSFVAYSTDDSDASFVWSKTLKTVFKLTKKTISFRYFPKQYKKVYGFGSDLSELDEKIKNYEKF